MYRKDIGEGEDGVRKTFIADLLSSRLNLLLLVS